MKKYLLDLKAETDEKSLVDAMTVSAGLVQRGGRIHGRTHGGGK
jgi:hypothetical protein